MLQYFTLARAVFLITFMITGFTLHGQTIRYVTPNGNGSANGSTWLNASNDLQAMINASDPTSGDMIWVASGTYIPNRSADATTILSPNNRNNAFVLKNNIKIYGGFLGNETSIEQRNWRTNTTTLSGDLGVAGTVSDNAYHVVISAGDTALAELNGFTITQGCASGGTALVVNGQNITPSFGGGIYVTGVSPVLSNLVVTGNTASSQGGALYFSAATATSLNNLVINNNTATFGGALYAGTSTIALYNTFITGNASQSGAGGIFCDAASSSITLVNVTISSNIGYGLFGTSTASPFVIKNTIIYGNENGTVGGTISAYNSLIQGTTTTTNGNISGAFDPQFVNVPLYTVAPFSGGDFRLGQCSTAINAGNNSYLPDAILTDALGNSRVYNNTIDMGASEWQGEILLPTIRYVKPIATGSGDGSSWDNASSDLQAMINTVCVAEVWVAAGTYIPVRRPDIIMSLSPNNRNNAFLLKSNVKVYGGFSGNETSIAQRDWVNNVTVLSGDINTAGVNTDNTYHVVMSIGAVGNAELNGVTIKGGYADGSTSITVNSKVINPKYGGALYFNASSPTLNHVLITNNYATTYGGGIYMAAYSAPIFINVKVDNNASPTGGGIYTSLSPITMYNSLVTGNYSGDGYGGIYVSGSGLFLTNVTISGNVGKGIQMFSSTSSWLKNCIVYGNQVGIGGSIPTLYNSLVQGIHLTDNNTLDGLTDPQFINAPDYILAPFTGGDYRLGQCSPAINAGNNSFLLPEITTDVYGNDRFYNNTTDIGAIEWHDDVYLPAIRYVKQVASGTGDGSSWENASDDLQAMIHTACVQQVWVAAGTYKPNRRIDNILGLTPNDHFNAFLLRNDVKIYGGFNGTETMLEQRNWMSNVTILSGDLGIIGETNDNAFHVVVSAGAVGQAELNGFTISGGNADDIAFEFEEILSNEQTIKTFNGGGVYTSASSPILTNLIVTENQSSSSGTGFYITAGSSPVLNNLIIKNNYRGSGVAIGCKSSNIVITNSLITGNGSLGSGCIFVESVDSVSIINTTIAGNNNTVFFDDDHETTFTIKNSIVYGNSYVSIYSDMLQIYNSLVQGFTSTANGNISGNVNPMFVNAPDYTTAPFSGGDYSLQPGSPVIDRGYNGYVPEGTLLDIAGNNRFSNTTVDMGAFEYQNQSCNTVPPPAAEEQVFCGTATVASLTATGQNLQWYTTVTEGQALATTTPLVSGVYYVSQTINGCQSARTPVNVTANGSAPTGVATQIISVDMPSEATIEDLVVQGEGIRWYASVDAITAGTPLAAGTLLVSGTTYYATQTVSGCESAYIAVTVQVVLGTATVENAKLTYYPNPVKEVLHITSGEVIGTVELYTLYGQKIAAYTWNTTNGMLNMQQLQQGAYMIKLTTESATQSFMVTKCY